MPKDQNSTYYEQFYSAPFKGLHTSLPENIIPPDASPSLQNCILRNGEIRSRPKQSLAIPGPDNSAILSVYTFQDANGVVHTCIVTQYGLYQLNRKWKIAFNQGNYTKIWSKVGMNPTQSGPNVPLATQTFVNKFFWTHGGNNLWQWDGINSIAKLSQWQPATRYYVGNQIQDSNGDWQICTQSGISQTPGPPAWVETIGNVLTDGTVQWTQNGTPFLANGGIQSVAIVDATNGISAGAYFLGELGGNLLMLNTIEGSAKGTGGQNFAQRIRWSANGIPNIWDPNVNIGAGFNDELDVPDAITGYISVGTTGFIFRVNGITEISINSNQSGTNPFSFNHLWASDRGIGNVYPFSIAAYGPIAIFISLDEIYELSLGGFKTIGKIARTSIYNDLANAIGTPIATIQPIYQYNYVYPQYILAIPLSNGTKIYRYSIEDGSWQVDFKTGGYFTGRPSFVAVT